MRGVCVCGCRCGVGTVHGVCVCVCELCRVCACGHVQIPVPSGIEQAGAELSAWAGT